MPITFTDGFGVKHKYVFEEPEVGSFNHARTIYIPMDIDYPLTHRFRVKIGEIEGKVTEELNGCPLIGFFYRVSS